MNRVLKVIGNLSFLKIYNLLKKPWQIRLLMLMEKTQSTNYIIKNIFNYTNNEIIE